MNNLKSGITGSIEFREAVFELTKTGRQIFARLGAGGRTYRIIYGDAFQVITVDDLLNEDHPPVAMETFATALVKAREAGRDIPEVLVFTD